MLGTPLLQICKLQQMLKLTQVLVLKVLQMVVLKAMLMAENKTAR